MTHVPLNELPEFARNVRAMLKLHPHSNGATTVWLRGNLGAGKTTFVQAIAEEYGITETLQSPTYVLMKSYVIPGELTEFGQKRRFIKLVHIDAYRLNSAEEFAALRPEEFLSEPGTLVFIEWPERVEAALPKPDMIIDFTADEAGEGERHITVQGEVE